MRNTRVAGHDRTMGGAIFAMALGPNAMRWFAFRVVFASGDAMCGSATGGPMRVPTSIPELFQQAGRGDTPAASVVEQILPPDPKAPSRPTIPPPTCGTLPPATHPVLQWLGGLKG